jgi:hypothetical protein
MRVRILLITSIRTSSAVGEKALEYVLNDVGVESVMFGMGTI